ncbi:MAG: DUF3306 domain-containing protein [Pseudolabrys sp.]
MNDPENFISRWSRRKREATDENAQPEKTAAEKTHEPTAPAEGANQDAPGSGTAAPPVPEFDVSSLPSIESIDAGTDITAFMQPGVPAALRHAALRRVWSADPAIRNFMGPNENYWDVAGLEGVPGFGDLDPNLDIKRLVSEVFGEPATEGDKAESASPAQTPERSAPLAARAAGDVAESQHARPTDDRLPHTTENAAPQNQPSTSSLPQKVARRHGGAMPE